MDSTLRTTMIDNPINLKFLGIFIITVQIMPHQLMLVLEYGCIYQGGFLFAVDDSTSDTGSIGGKVAALTNSDTVGLTWANVFDVTTATSLTME